MKTDLQFIVKEDVTHFEQYFSRTRIGLKPLRRRPPLEAFESGFTAILEDLDALRWQLGDLAYMLAKEHGTEAYEQVAARYLEDRLAARVEDWAYVCRNVAYEIRRSDLTLSHHRKVGPIKDGEEQACWLNEAAREGWSVRQLTDAIARANQEPPPPRKEDRLFEMEMENAALYRRVDNLVREQAEITKSTETKFKTIRSVLLELVSLGPDGLVRDPAGVLARLREVLVLLGEES